MITGVSLPCLSCGTTAVRGGLCVHHMERLLCSPRLLVRRTSARANAGCDGKVLCGSCSAQTCSVSNPPDQSRHVVHEITLTDGRHTLQGSAGTTHRAHRSHELSLDGLPVCAAPAEHVLRLAQRCQLLASFIRLRQTVQAAADTLPGHVVDSMPHLGAAQELHFCYACLCAQLPVSVLRVQCLLAGTAGQERQPVNLGVEVRGGHRARGWVEAGGHLHSDAACAFTLLCCSGG